MVAGGSPGWQDSGNRPATRHLRPPPATRNDWLAHLLLASGGKSTLSLIPIHL